MVDRRIWDEDFKKDFKETGVTRCSLVSCGSGQMREDALYQHSSLGCAIAEAVSRRLPTPAALIRSQVRSYEICGGE
jgi:hypothetical protein